MRKSLSYLSAFLLTAALAACSNNLNIQAPYKNISVVYGLMDQSDTAHYIRINRAYEGIGNAIKTASNFDSVYYPVSQITALLQAYDVNGNPDGLAIHLSVDSSIALPPGMFPYPKQYLYKTKAALNVNDTYSLTVTNNHTHQVLTGSTYLLPDAALPSFGANFSMSFNTTFGSTIGWNSTPNGLIYQMTFRFFYHEHSSSENAEKSFDWVFASQTAPSIVGGYPMTYNYNAYEFLNLVAANIPVEAGVTRTADSLKLIFTTGSEDFNTYIQLSEPSLGIDQDPPSFSDVTNGIGIYTCRHTQTVTKPISSQLTDSLIGNSITKPLNFQL